MPSLSETLVDFCLELRPEDIPADVLDNVRLNIIDCIAVGHLAAATEHGACIARYLERHDDGDVSCWGLGRRSRLAEAVLANGTLSGSMNFDDTHNESQLHPGAHLVPLAIGIAEADDLSTETMTVALVAALEAACRLAIVAPGEFSKKGFHSSSVLGKIYCALLVARMRGLDREAAVSAVGHAASQAGGLMQCYLDGSWTLGFHHGWAATSALVAADMAEAGYPGPREALDGPLGLFSAFLTPQVLEAGSVRACKNLGTEWECRNMSLKPYATGCVIHPYIDCLMELIHEHRIDADDVEQVTAVIADYLVPIVCAPIDLKRAPSSVFNARVSLPFILANCFYRDPADPLSISEASIADPAVQSLAGRIGYIPDPEPADRRDFIGHIVIELKSGGRLERRLHPWKRLHMGHPGTEEDLHGKFRRCMSACTDRVEDAMKLVDNLQVDMPVRAMMAELAETCNVAYKWQTRG